MKFLRVTRQKPCAICEHPDWCGVSEDDSIAICMRVQSARPARNGGWVHRLLDAPPAYVPAPRAKPARPLLPGLDAMMQGWICETAPESVCDLAAALGVSVDALAELGVAWAARHGAWAFPMRGGDGQTVGIRLRSETRKWAVTGSREGLFYPERQPADHVAVVCEGPTDTAAALTLGLWAVGRPSCMGGVDALKALCRRLYITHLIVVGDNDAPKPRLGGGWWTPGLDGARRLMSEIGLPCKLVLPPSKDMRQWLQNGATRSDFEALVSNQSWRIGYGR